MQMYYATGMWYHINTITGVYMQESCIYGNCTVLERGSGAVVKEVAVIEPIPSRSEPEVGF